MTSPPVPGTGVLDCPPPRLDGGRQAVLLAEAWGHRGVRLSPLPSERDLNVLVDDRYVLKVSNPAESPDVVDMETTALAHAGRVAPDLPLPATVATLDGTATTVVEDDDGRPCLARLITVVPGAAAEGRAITADLAEQIGAVCARTSLALQGLFHPAADRRLDWDVRRAPAVVAAARTPPPLHPSLGGDGGRRLLDRLAAVADATRALPSGVNHADVTLTNVLVADGRVTGVIDFGDMHHTAHVCDLAVTLTSVLRNTAPEQPLDTWELARATVTGYQRHRPLAPEEVDVLGDLVVARLVLTLAISARRGDAYADNSAYITQYDAATTRVLDELLDAGPEAVRARLHRIAGTGRAPRATRTVGAGTLLERRRRVMGGPLSPLFYRHPLEIVRGEGPWLEAADGTRYLDAYNNVAVLGHAHPAVVQAVSRQLAALNTHSRYLHPGVVELAERLVATMPAGLDTCLFTTSGTEANELAWRLATAYTGGTGAIVAEHAYHGSSRWFADLSSNEWPPGYRPAHVATFAAPRVTTGGVDGDTARARVLDAAARLRDGGDEPALLLVDPGFTSEGVLDAPTPFLTGLVDGAHDSGALFLADEVQSGFGRIGPPLWRFAAHGLVPDVVTLGKPMGAGYPVGAVVTRREIADALARDYEYFSTFAATPAAAAAALAVLDTLQHSAIPRDAVEVGEYLRERLRAVAAAHPGLGEVRGRGLMAGVDTHPPDALPDKAFARALLDELAARRVLAGLTGPTSAVLKIRPPLVWRRDHVDRFADALDGALAALA